MRITTSARSIIGEHILGGQVVIRQGGQDESIFTDGGGILLIPTNAIVRWDKLRVRRGPQGINLNI